MNEKTLELLCEKFGTTVEYLIPKAQAYGIWSSATGLISAGLIIIFTIIYIKDISKKYENDWFDDMSTIEFVLMVLGLAFTVIALIVFICLIPELIMWITAPEIGLLKLIK